jgi:F1F0 ATPase subunit 2
MNETLMQVVAGATGLVLGAAFFGGLWWTVRMGVSTPYPAFWFLGSWILRVGLVLAGFHLVGDGKWQRLLSCLVGFAVSRVLVIRMTRVVVAHPTSRIREPSDAT